MALGFLIALTLASLAWSLWIRRFTWRCRWEVAATLNIALQGAAVLLMAPFTSATVGTWLHGLTGDWNLEDYLGHDCYVVAASAIAFNVVSRLEGNQQRAFKIWVETPATLCIPLLLASFVRSSAVDTYYSDFFRCPTDTWCTIYWMLLCATLLWLLGYGSHATLSLRQDPRSRKVANIYLLSSASGMLACISRIFTAFLPAARQDTYIASVVVWIFACICGAGYALTSAYSWRAKSRWFTHAQ